MHNDYLMRQIQEMFTALAKTLFLKNTDMHDLFNERGEFQEGEFLYYRLKRLVFEKKINEAENILFETIEQYASMQYLKTAMDFYGLLNGFSDDELETANFSREEISEGVSEINRIYNQLS